MNRNFVSWTFVPRHCRVSIVARVFSDYEEATVPSNVDPGTFDVHSLDYKRTALHAQFTDPFYTYDRVQWILEIRKEVIIANFIVQGSLLC